MIIVELEEPSIAFKPVVDNRPRVPEPLPVKLVAVEDVRLPAPAGVEVQLDAFYVSLWEFERIEAELTYRAENFQLRFEVREAPVDHETLRPTIIEIPSLAEAEKKLIDAEIEYVRQRSLTPGHESLLLRDPAGNWIVLMGTSRV